MKKIIFIGILTSLMFAAFLPNREYTCNTIGLSFKDKNQTINVPNNAKTKDKLKKVLKYLYTLKIKFTDNGLTVTTSKNKDTLKYLKKFKNLDVYITSDKQGLMFVDNNQTQIGFMVPSQQTMIYYQCK